MENGPFIDCLPIKHWYISPRGYVPILPPDLLVLSGLLFDTALAALRHAVAASPQKELMVEAGACGVQGEPPVGRLLGKPMTIYTLW